MKRLVGLFFLVSVLFSFDIQGQEASASLSNKEIRIGEQTTISLELKIPADKKTVMLPTLKDTISKFVEIVEISDVDTIFDEDDITKKVFKQSIIITSWDSGYHVIPPFQFVVEKDSLETKAMMLTVNTIPVVSDQDIKDIKGIKEVPFSLWDWVLSNRIAIGSTILILLVLLIAYFLYKKYKRKPVQKETSVPKEAADLVALKKLKELEQKKLLEKNKVKDFHTELSFIVREYLENRFQIRALELTTYETDLILKYQSEITKETKEKIYELLSLTDMVKFAKQEPQPSENAAALKAAFLIIEKTALKEETNESDQVTNQSTEQ